METYKWILYERYKQIFRHARTSNIYGGRCSALYEKTCPSQSNTLANCEPLCAWYKTYVIHETTAVGCTCDLECVERDKSATPLDHAIGGAAIEFYSALGLSCVLLAMRVTHIHALSLSASVSAPAPLPLSHERAHTLTHRYCRLLLNVVISAPQDIEPTRDSLLNFQKTIGETVIHRV